MFVEFFVYVALLLLKYLRAYINYPFLETTYVDLKRMSKNLITFLFFHKKFP